MTNYIKSECYRTLHTKWVYGSGIILSGLTILFHLVIWLFNTFTPNFRYHTTSFSYSNLVGQPMLYCILAFVIAAILYEETQKRHPEKYHCLRHFPYQHFPGKMYCQPDYCPCPPDSCYGRLYRKRLPIAVSGWPSKATGFTAGNPCGFTGSCFFFDSGYFCDGSF